MHLAATMKHWSHHLHDNLLMVRHHIDEHLHSRHFWVGVGLMLLIAGIVTLLFILASSAPYIYPEGVPYLPYQA